MSACCGRAARRRRQSLPLILLLLMISSGDLMGELLVVLELLAALLTKVLIRGRHGRRGSESRDVASLAIVENCGLGRRHFRRKGQRDSRVGGIAAAVKELAVDFLLRLEQLSVFFLAVSLAR